jgi:hypothetical protein
MRSCSNFDALKTEGLYCPRLCVCASAQSGDGVEWLTAVPDDADAHVAKRNPL